MNKNELLRYLLYKIKKLNLYKILIRYPAIKRGDSSKEYIAFLVTTYPPKDWIKRLELGLHIPKSLTESRGRILLRFYSLEKAFNERIKIEENNSSKPCNESNTEH